MDQLKWNADVVEVYKLGEDVALESSKALLRQAGLSGSSETRAITVLDNAAGTGIISHLLQGDASIKDRMAELVCADLSEKMVESVQGRIVKEGWKNASAVVADGQDTKVRPFLEPVQRNKLMSR